MSSMNIDMAILREWAEAKVSGKYFATDHDLPVARHILDATPTPTMAEVEWEDDVHAGLCAESTDDGVVRMIGLDWENDHADHILCYLRPGVFDSLPMRSLTPLPGTRLDLTPRREPEFTPDHPEFLETEEDYENAPEGTIVAQDEGKPFVLMDEWRMVANSGFFDHGDMSGIRRRVLRWGWEA